MAATVAGAGNKIFSAHRQTDPGKGFNVRKSRFTLLSRNISSIKLKNYFI